MKRKVFELIRRTNTLREGKDFEGLDSLYSRLGDFLTHLRQMKRLRLDKLESLLENDDQVLTAIRLLDRSDRNILGELVFRRLKTALEDQFEEMYVPYEVVFEAAKVYAESVEKKREKDNAAKKKGWKASSHVQKEQNVDEQTTAKKESWLFDHVLNKRGWMVIPICLNVLILLLCFKFGSQILKTVYG